MYPSPSMSLSHLQVQAARKDGIHIPDHDVITRREQFRMKKTKAEDKRQKKEEKKERNKEKKAQQAAKKAEKAAKKADKEQEKADKGSGKRGRKATEKSKNMQAKRRQNKKNQEINDSETHEQEEAAPSSHEPDQEKKSCKARGRPMKRLQKITHSHKASSVSEVDFASKPKKAKKKVKCAPQPETAKGDWENDNTDGNQVDETVNIKDGNKDDPNHKEIPTTDVDKVVAEPKELEVEESGKKGTKSSGSGLKRTAAKSKPKSTQQPKAKATAKSKQSKKTSDGTDPEKKTRKKRTTKDLGVTDETKATPKRTKRSTKPGTTAEVDPQVKDAIAKTLAECEESKCTHPSWEKSKNKFIDLQPYNGRLSCGVKAPRSFFTNHKAHGKGKAHVTYFGCKTTCIYTNMVLGSLWVSRLHLSICVKGSNNEL